MIISHAKKFAFFRVPKCGSTTSEFMLRLSDAFDDNVDIMTQCFGGFKMKNIPAALFARIKKREQFIRGGNLQMFDGPRRPENMPKQGDVAGLSVAHMTPSDAIDHGIITIEQLREYDCYAFIRDPHDRYVSAFIFGGGPLAIPEIMLKSALRPGFSMGLVEKPQWNWFYVDGEQVVEPLDFSNYTEELKHLIVGIGGYPFAQIPRINEATARLNKVTNDEYYTENARQLVAQKFTRDITMWHNYRAIWDA